MIGELRFPETNRPNVVVLYMGAIQQTDMNLIEIRVSQVPQLDAAQIVQTESVRDRFVRRARERNAL